MMYRILFLLAISWTLTACGQSANEAGEGADESNAEAGDVQVELRFKEAKPSIRKVMITAINRSDKTIASLEGELIFKDASGEVLSYSDGRPWTSPFSKVGTPDLVEAKQQKELDIMVPSMPGEFETVEVKLEKATFKDRSTFEPE